MDQQIIRQSNPARPRSKPEPLMKLMRGVVQLTCFCLMLGAVAVQAQEPINSTPKKPVTESVPAKVGQPITPQKIVEQGIAIEFTIDPNDEKSKGVIAGEDATVKFKVTDTTTGTPVKGLNLSAWISMRDGDKTDLKQCREKVQSFLGASMRARPDVDLNSYYILALNGSPDISVIDPLLGFGGSKLIALVMLKSPGEDWVLSRDGERLFVTLPLINQVAVIETRSWKVLTYIDTGIKPKDLALQPDQHYLWVANDGDKPEEGGVTVIDTATLKVAAQIATGAGPHELVISTDNRFAFVSNKASSTVSVVDVRKLAKTGDVKLSSQPGSMALSELSKAIYVGGESDGAITVIDAQSQKILARMKAKPGLRSIRITPDGRYGFGINTKENTLNIFDAASNRMLHEVEVGKAPDQITFSSIFAFVRSLDTESVHMIRLSTLGKDVEVTEFPGGQIAPGQASPPVRADSMVLAPEGNAVIVANPGDKVLYYYTEGMAAPMGDFQNYKREPKGVMIVDRSLRETQAGIYTTTIKLPGTGKYDVAILADSPRVTHCFEAVAGKNPLLKEEQPVALRIENVIKEMKFPARQDFPLRFKLIDTKTNKPKADLKDVMVLTFAPGSVQRRDLAKSLGDGIYEITLNVPEPGFYLVFVQSASMRVKFRDLPYVTLEVVEGKIAPASVSAQRGEGRKP
ncbi:MAG TPA: cytochrome D1 domain-containing protein [Pyrinomonadaceae bacterium]|nr:cytochrome D1 domain-containing protein [Pyrinomonadaceae bacterium]